MTRACRRAKGLVSIDPMEMEIIVKTEDKAASSRC